MSDMNMGMKKKLVGLTEQPWRVLLGFLSSYEIGRLALTGSKLVLNKLELNVVEFKHHPRGIRRNGWPRIISLFTRLQSLEISAFDHTNPPPYVNGVDIWTIPRRIRSLKLMIANGFFAFLHSPSPAQILGLNFSFVSNIRSHFPDIRELCWLDSYHACHSPISMRTFQSSKLIRLHIPSTPELTASSIACLPETLTDLHFTASATETRWSPLSFPPRLLYLSIDQFPVFKAPFMLPETLATLKLSSQDKSDWKCIGLPKSLRELSIIALAVTLPLAFFSSLPKNMKVLFLHVQHIEAGFDGLLPQLIHKLSVQTCESLNEIPSRFKLPYLVESPSWIMSVPVERWKSLPRTLERVHDPSVFQLPVSTPSMMATLPQRMTEVYFTGVPTTLPFAYLRHLAIQMRNNEDYDNLDHLLSGGLQEKLTKLSIGGKCMIDPSVLENLRGSTVKELVIEWCDPTTWSCLHHDWCSNLESLTIKKGPWKPCLRVWREPKPLATEGGEEWDFETFWPVHLRHSRSLTFLSLGPGCLQFSGDPSFIPMWPGRLKSLVLYDAIPILDYACYEDDMVPIEGNLARNETVSEHKAEKWTQKGEKEQETGNSCHMQRQSTSVAKESGECAKDELWKRMDSEMELSKGKNMRMEPWNAFPSSLLHLDMPVYGIDHIPPNHLIKALLSLPKSLITLRLQGIQMDSTEDISSQILLYFIQLPSNRLHALYDTSKTRNWMEEIGKPKWDEALLVAIDSTRSTAALAPSPSTPLQQPYHFRNNSLVYPCISTSIPS